MHPCGKYKSRPGATIDRVTGSKHCPGYAIDFFFKREKKLKLVKKTKFALQ